jgi:hypothetical protein
LTQDSLTSMSKKSKLKLALGGPVKFLRQNNLFLIVDSKNHKLGRIVFDVWAGAFEALADKLVEQFPDEKERGEFTEAMVKDLANPAFQLYTWV